MKATIHSDTELVLDEFDTPALEIESANGHAHFSALPMFLMSMGWCTFSVIVQYGEQFDADPSDVSIHIDWEYTEDPFRVSKIEMDVTWPELPDSRLDAVERAAGKCTIHNTLEHPPEIVTRVQNDK